VSEPANEAASEALSVLPPGASEWELGAGAGAGGGVQGLEARGWGWGWKRQFTQFIPTVSNGSRGAKQIYRVILPKACITLSSKAGGQQQNCSKQNELKKGLAVSAKNP
jgi:hypothetical protein